MGLIRVRSVFDHPILFGVCTGGIIALVHLVLGYQKSFFQRCLQDRDRRSNVDFVVVRRACKRAIVTQGFLLSWNGLLRGIKNSVENSDRPSGFDRSID